jgi:hypothetical protein
MGVELLKGDVGLPAYTLLPNSEYHRDYLGSESARDNLRVGEALQDGMGRGCYERSRIPCVLRSSFAAA